MSAAILQLKLLSTGDVVSQYTWQIYLPKNLATASVRVRTWSFS